MTAHCDACRHRHRRDSIMGGMLGVGIMGAGFGPLGAVGGLLIGAILGWLVERRACSGGREGGAAEPR